MAEAQERAARLEALEAAANARAAEAMRRDVKRFTGELSSYNACVSVKTGNSYHVRMSGDHVYLRRIVPPGASWSVNEECVPAQTPGSWSCTNYLNASRRNKTCLLESHGTLSAVSLDRITGEGDGFGPKDIDWRKCTIKKTTRVSFTLIPRGSQQ